MSRPIKYRAYHPTRGMSYFVVSIEPNSDGSIHGCVVYRKGLYVEIYGGNDLIWTEWTGLKDKNGRDIYEGDILVDDTDWYINQTDDHSYLNNTLVNYEVYWKSEWGGFEAKDLVCKKDQDGELFGDWAITTKVIGNIYENSDLLKQ